MALYYVELIENAATGQFDISQQAVNEDGYEDAYDLFRDVTSDGSRLFKLGTDELRPGMADIRDRINGQVESVFAFQYEADGEVSYSAFVEREAALS